MSLEFPIQMPTPAMPPEVWASQPPLPITLPTGQAGLNAYQLAVIGASGASPFVGTMTEWLASLEGAVGAQGVAGPQGLRGAQGSATATHVHEQMSASSEWLISHDLGKHPSVTVVDSAGSVVVGQVHYASVGQLAITFSAAFAGTAYLN